VEIPQELVWIQQLIDIYGVTGTLRLISVNCGDRAALPGENSVQWARLAQIVADAVQQARGLEPERTVREEGHKTQS
jgi:hypothetical protein